MTTRLPKMFPIIFGVLGGISLLIMLVIGKTLIECEQLRQIPEAPVITQAVLLRIGDDVTPDNSYSLLLAIIGAKDQMNLVTSYYETDIPAEDIRAFYENIGECEEYAASESIRCIGKTNEFGEFHALINKASDTEPLVIETRWWSCSKSI